MPSKIFNKDFSAGWIPSDSIFSSRSNGLIRMGNMCLDQKGVLTYRVPPTWNYPNSTTQNFTALGGSPSIKYFSFIGIPIGGSVVSKVRYILTAAGHLWRSIVPQALPPAINIPDTFVDLGSGFNTSPVPNFLAAGGQVFITGEAKGSGFNLFKDDAVTVRRWGIEATGPLNTVAGLTVNIYKGAMVQASTNFSSTTAGSGGTIPFVSATEISMQITAANTTVTFTQSVGVNLNLLTYNQAGSPLNATTDTGTPNDTFIFPVSSQFSGKAILLTFQDSTSKTFTFLFNSNASLLNTPLTCLRSDFNGSANWANIVSWSITFTSEGAGDEVTLYNPNPSYTDSIFGFIGGSQSQLQSDADSIENPYQAAVQIGYLSSDGNYNGLSVLSPVSTTLPSGGPYSGSLQYQYNAYIYVTTPATSPTSDGQINTFWFYVRGGTLEQWYLADIIGLNATAVISGPDTTLANINQTYLDSLEPLSSINEVILEVIGPVNGRLLLLTPTYIYFTDVLNFEVIDANMTVRLGQAVTDFNLFIKKVSNQVVNVGTTSEVYEITGSFDLGGDGITYDIVVTHLGQQTNPPISYAACVYDSILFFHSKDGIRALSGSNSEIISPNLISLFRQNNVNGIDNIGLIGGGQSTASLVAGRQKIFFSAESDNASGLNINRVVYEYDLVTKTWNERIFLAGTVPINWFTDSDGVTIVVCEDGFCRYYEPPFTADNDGGATGILFKTPLNDGGDPNVRKTIETLMLNLNTNGQNISVSLYSENITGITSYTLNNTSYGRLAIDVSEDPNTNSCRYGLIITGPNSIPGNILITDWSLSYEPRVDLCNTYIILPTNFGSSAPKKFSTLSFVINTLGQPISFQPKVDGVVVSQGPLVTINTADKQTVIYYFRGAVFGTDFSGIFESEVETGSVRPSFELYTTDGEVFLKPTTLEVLPDSKLFDQAGPIVLDRRGRLLAVRTRIMGYKTGTVGDFDVTCNIFLDEVLAYSFNTMVYIGVDTTYEFMQLPKTLVGNILRLEYSSTTIPFIRWNTRVKVDFSGNDTDNTWIGDKDEVQQ